MYHVIGRCNIAYDIMWSAERSLSRQENRRGPPPDYHVSLLQCLHYNYEAQQKTVMHFSFVDILSIDYMYVNVLSIEQGQVSVYIIPE